LVVVDIHTASVGVCVDATDPHIPLRNGQSQAPTVNLAAEQHHLGTDRKRLKVALINDQIDRLAMKQGARIASAAINFEGDPRVRLIADHRQIGHQPGAAGYGKGLPSFSTAEIPKTGWALNAIISQRSVRWRQEQETAGQEQNQPGSYTSMNNSVTGEMRSHIQIRLPL